MGRRFVAYLLLSLPLASAVAFGDSLRFLRNAAIAQFTKEDLRLQRAAAAAVLASDESQAEQVWHNEKSGNSGTVTLLSRSTIEARPCRLIRVQAHARLRKDVWTWNVCRAGSGEWRIDTTPPQKG